MPDADVEMEFTDAEYAAAIEQFDVERETKEHGDERFEAANDNEPGDSGAEPSVEPAMQALLEGHSGKEGDWQLMDSGRGEYWFNGQEVVDREGNVWTNPDAELHEAMLEQWQSGGETFFLLPDYTVRKEEGDTIIETLYVTQLHLERETGAVSWAIHAHETSYQKEEDVGVALPGRDRDSEQAIARWEEVLEADPADDDVEEREAALAAAELREEAILEREEWSEIDEKLQTMIEALLGEEQSAGHESHASVEEVLLDPAQAELGAVLRAAGIRPSLSEGSNLQAEGGMRAASKEKPVYVADLNGIRMERYAA